MNKICTTIEQSKKLIELGIDVNTADMFWDMAEPNKRRKPIVGPISDYFDMEDWAVPGWSLSALLSVLPKGTDIIKEEADTEDEQYMCTVGTKSGIMSTFGNNPIDACVAIIIKLNELNLL